MVKDPLSVIKKAKLDYALTTYQAENIVQHYLFPTRIDLYIKEADLHSWHNLMTKNGLYGKGNVRIIIADDHNLTKYISEKILKKCLKSITNKDFEMVSAQIQHEKEELKRVIGLICERR